MLTPRPPLTAGRGGKAPIEPPKGVGKYSLRLWLDGLRPEPQGAEQELLMHWSSACSQRLMTARGDWVPRSCSRSGCLFMH